jgi:RNase P subunit RPR2
MKLVIKKTYCRGCKRLVGGKEQKKNKDHLEVVCPRCNRILWTYNGLVWRYAVEATK